MLPSAHLTLLWGDDVLGARHLPIGHEVVVSASGFEGGAADGEAAIVRMTLHGAVVEATAHGTSANARPPRRIPLGCARDVALAGAVGGDPYRQRQAWRAEPVVLRIAVAEDTPSTRRLRAPPRLLSIALTAATGLHTAALIVSASAMPPLDPLEDTLFGPQNYLLQRIEIDTSEPVAPPEPEQTEGGDPHLCMELDGPMRGRSLSVAGPPDNPDPHIARSRPPLSWTPIPGASHLLSSLGVGPRLESYEDSLAPTVPWGRDDSLGFDDTSSSGIVPGTPVRRFAGCFGEPPPSWTCNGELAPPRTAATLGLDGIGEELASPPDTWRRRREPRVALGHVGVKANLPGWRISAAVREGVESWRACYDRALADAPYLTGRIDVALRVHADSVQVALRSSDRLESAHELRCCIEHTHDGMAADLPPGTSARAVYTIELGPVRSR